MFYAAMERHGLRYGILSDRYGIHMDDERLDYYDVHPSQLSQEPKRRLGEIIGWKVRERGYPGVIFWSPSPQLAILYFEMLSHSGLTRLYLHSLRLLDSDVPAEGGERLWRMKRRHAGKEGVPQS